MKIGIDLDGTLVKFCSAALDEVSKRGFGDFVEADIKTYKFEDSIPEFTKKDWEDVYFKTLLGEPDFFERLEPYSTQDMIYARELCNIVDVYIVSARSETPKGLASTTQQTAAWCRLHNLPVAGVYISNTHKKAEALKFLGCEFFLDDSPKTFVNCLENGINVWLYDQPWNQEIPTGKRLYGISEYYKIVRKAIK
jgi:5'(3')-deoxyribonucleotidase